MKKKVQENKKNCKKKKKKNQEFSFYEKYFLKKIQEFILLRKIFLEFFIFCIKMKIKLFNFERKI